MSETMNVEERVRTLESNQEKIKEGLHKIDTSLALLNQNVETLKEDRKERKATSTKLWMFGAGSIISTGLAWLYRVLGIGS